MPVEVGGLRCANVGAVVIDPFVPQPQEGSVPDNGRLDVAHAVERAAFPRMCSRRSSIHFTGHPAVRARDTRQDDVRIHHAFDAEAPADLRGDCRSSPQRRSSFSSRIPTGTAAPDSPREGAGSITVQGSVRERRCGFRGCRFAVSPGVFSRSRGKFCPR